MEYTSNERGRVRPERSESEAPVTSRLGSGVLDGQLQRDAKGTDDAEIVSRQPCSYWFLMAATMAGGIPMAIARCHVEYSLEQHAARLFRKAARMEGGWPIAVARCKDA